MADVSNPTKRRLPIALTFFGLLAIAGLVAMPFVAGAPGEKELPDLVRFLGHFHPVVLHLPIGVFMLILVQEIGLIFFRSGRDPEKDSLFPMFFGAASAIVAVIAGFLLYHGHADDYAGQEIAERHLWGGLAFAVAAVVTFIAKAWTVALVANAAWYRLLLFGSVGVMGFASHDGASMTHGSDYLTKYAPDPLRKILGLEPKTEKEPAGEEADPVVYADIVAPILERRCVQCHKPGKIKGKLRMDTYEMLLKGGSEGPAIELGSAAKSNIVVRIELPEDDDERMPPDGKPGLDPDELALLKWWLDSGGDPLKTVSQLAPPAEIQSILGKLDAAPKSLPKETSAGDEGIAPKAPVVDEALKSTVKGLSKEFPGALTFESQQSPNVTFTAVSMRGKLDDEGFGKLGPVVPNLVTVDLSATKITDKAVAALEAAPRLRQLRLAETAITDAAIDSLLKVQSLESLNFYGTKVTDAGIAKLAALPNLKRLYLWQTAVTPAGIEALKQKLPGCEIVSGIAVAE